MQVSGANIHRFQAVTGKRGKELSGEYVELVHRRQASDDSAKSFIKELSIKELMAVQKANGLAGRIRVDALSDEGAENLFLGKMLGSDFVDLDNNAIVEIGEAKSFHYPPVNAPQEVKDAWERKTEGMPEMELIMLQGSMLMHMLTQNFVERPDGSFYSRDYDDPNWVNPYDGSKESFVKAYEKIADRIDEFWRQIPFDQQESALKRRDIFLDLADELS